MVSSPRRFLFETTYICSRYFTTLTFSWISHLHPICRFDITPGGQQIHIAIGPVEVESARHPCFKLETEEQLWQLQGRIYVSYPPFLNLFE